jgi:CubicO group peptidase (beta-lactamase class C family)
MKRITLFLCIVIMIVGVLPIHAQGEFDAAVAQNLQALIDNAIEQGDPGVVIVVETPNGTFEGIGGYANQEEGVLLQVDDAFRVGSVNKMFTSVVILQLMEEGLLNLDDTLAEWLPEAAAMIPNSDVITIRQLLNLSSGIHDHMAAIEEDFVVSEDAQQRVWEPMELVSSIAADDTDFAPGEGWAYSNTNFILLGLVIEAATGQTVVENFHARIIDPLGLTHTYMADDEAPTADIVRGYSSYIGTNDFNASSTWTAGALVSNAPEMIIFLRALLSGSLFSDPSTLEIMLTPTEASVNAFGEGFGYGLGMFNFNTPFGPIYGHTGDTFGFHTKVYYFVDYDAALVQLSNTDEPSIDIFMLAGALAELPLAE